MNATTARKILVVAVAVFFVSLMFGCSGMLPSPDNRYGHAYYPAELVNADRALDEARAAGKDGNARQNSMR